MTAAHHRPVPTPDPVRSADGSAETETVYLRACPGERWSVHLGARLILLTEAEEEAFQAACAAARREGHPSRPMLLLSGPGALRATPVRHEA